MVLTKTLEKVRCPTLASYLFKMWLLAPPCGRSVNNNNEYSTTAEDICECDVGIVKED